MKKILLLLAFSVSMLHSMEEKKEATTWQDLPKELQAQILSFVPKANTLAEGLKRLKSFATVSSGFRDIVNNPHVIETFSNYVINKNVKNNKESATAEFINALKNGDMNLANMFIEAGINVNGNESAIKEFSDEAAWGGNIDIIKSFIKAGIHLNSNEYAVDSFITAVNWGDIDTVKPFVEAGIDVNASSKEGWNALQRTVLNNHQEIAELLLEAKADVNAQNAHGYALTWAVLKNNPKMVKLFLESGANADSIQEAAGRVYDANEEIKSLLRRHGANI